MTTLKIQSLKKILDRVIHSLEQESSELKFEENLYWEIKESDIFNMEKEPKDFYVGNLSEDISEIEEILKSNEYLLPEFILPKLANLFQAYVVTKNKQ